MSHTPGPWTFRHSDGANHIESEVKDGHLCAQLSICDEQYYPWIQAHDDDWQLIAAAPDLLTALKNLLRGYVKDSSEDFRASLSDLMADAGEAIRKAEGKP